MNTLTGCVVFVTGASRGIGKATAIRFAAEGADIAICARSLSQVVARSSGEQTIEAINQLGRRVLAFEADLADPAHDRAAMIDRVERELGPIDILVNNAALGGYKPFTAWSELELRAMQEVNVWAPWQLAQRVLPGMVERGRGWVLNVSSAAAIGPTGPPFDGGIVAKGGTAYGGTKAMLNRITQSMAAEYHGTGVAINAVAPTAATRTEKVIVSNKRGEIPEHLTEPIETMVEANLALCSCDPATTTGQIAYSLQLLRDLDRPVFDLHGRDLIEGWQPVDLPARLAKMGRR